MVAEIIVECRNCFQLNRIDKEEKIYIAKCGKCKESLSKNVTIENVKVGIKTVEYIRINHLQYGQYQITAWVDDNSPKVKTIDKADKLCFGYYHPPLDINGRRVMGSVSEVRHFYNFEYGGFKEEEWRQSIEKQVKYHYETYPKIKQKYI